MISTRLRPTYWCKGDIACLMVNVRSGEEAFFPLELTNSLFHVSVIRGAPWWRFTLRDGRGLGAAADWYLVAEGETALETIARARALQAQRDEEEAFVPPPESATRLRKALRSPSAEQRGDAVLIALCQQNRRVAR